MTPTEQLNARLAGRYTIEREIGRGGMATVYIARDLRHDRHVALKVLDPELGAVLGGERFLSEIRVTANLQHPNLLPLFDSGDADGLLYYVMPFVEGESLRAKLDREQQLPVDEAVRIAVAVASAVDYAHRHGVVHRDLKPENILLHDGQPLVADFGIALAVSNAGGSRITQTGLSLGTPQYMSPEQATGDRAVDGRADVYSLGAVTYEMLTGEAPHTGKTAQAIIAKLMTEEPRPVTTLRKTVPANVHAAVHRALEKLPADRFSTAREFGDALQNRGAATTQPASSFHGAARAGTWKLVAIGALIIAAVATAVAVRGARRTDAAAPRVRFTLALPDSQAINYTATPIGSLTLSPDGSHLAWVGGPSSHVFVKRIDELVPRKLVAEGAATVRFAPSGDAVFFTVGYTLKRVALAGGPVTKIAEGVGPFAVGNGVIVSAGASSPGPTLFQVSANGGRSEQVTPPPLPDERVYGVPSFLPDGDAVLFPIVRTVRSAGVSEIAVMRLSDRKIIRLGIAGANPIYLSTGHILAVTNDGVAVATPFDATSLRVTGPGVPVLQDVLTKSATIAEISVSSNGTLAYIPGDAEQQLVEVDRAGKARMVAPMTRAFRHPRYSPDGRRIVTSIGQAPSSDVWLLDVRSSTLSRVTNDGSSVTPEWSPDGRRVAWTSFGEKNGAYWQPWDLSSPPELLVAESRGITFSPDGAFFLTNLGTPTVVTLVRLDSSRRRTPLMSVGTPMSAVSPDGKWIAYADAESGGRQVNIRSIAGGGVYQISDNGGFEPVWNPRGGELFYRTTASLVSAKLELAPTPRVISRATLFTMSFRFGLVQAAYDVSADGNHFLMPKPAASVTPAVFVVGWLDEVRERLRSAEKK